MHSDTATHAVLYRLGRPIRVAPLADSQAMSDFRVAEMLTIGIYSITRVDAKGAQAAEDAVEGLRAAVQVMASPAWRAAIAA